MAYRILAACIALVLVIGGSAGDVESRSQPALVVKGEVRQRLELSLEEIQKLPHVEITVESRGESETVRGVPVVEVLRLAGVPLGHQHGKNMSIYVLAGAADAYEVVFSLAELDPDMSDKQVLIVDQKGGQPLDAEEGPLTIVAVGDKRHDRWVRQVVRLEVRRG